MSSCRGHAACNGSMRPSQQPNLSAKDTAPAHCQGIQKRLLRVRGRVTAVNRPAPNANNATRPCRTQRSTNTTQGHTNKNESQRLREERFTTRRDSGEPSSRVDRHFAEPTRRHPTAQAPLRDAVGACITTTHAKILKKSRINDSRKGKAEK